MIHGPEFIILHFGRTGGDAIKQIFLTLNLPNVLVDPIDHPQKHFLPHERGIDTEGKELALGIRRLPYWELSFMHHRIDHGFVPRGASEPMGVLDTETIIESCEGEIRLRDYTWDQPSSISHWIRTEFLREDVIRFLSNYYELSAEQIETINSTTTKEALPYERDLSRWFSADQLQRLYERCPLWAGVEREQYGGLLTLEDSDSRPPDAAIRDGEGSDREKHRS